MLVLGISTAQLIGLFSKAIPNRKEVPASLLVHIPDIRLLTRVLCVVLIDQVHDKKPKQSSKEQL
jgi:hypothetical protein